jgi:nicotinate-nucleotide adenylyltransferase
MRRLCFGGSFNPVHHGHLICARAVAEARGFERVVLIPSAQPPHKLETAELAPPQDRLAMCREAVEGDDLFEVSDIELSRSGPSFTIDTVLELRRQGWKKVAWLIGADMVATLPKWRRPVELMREAELVVMARPGWLFDWEGLPPEYRHLKDNVVPAPLIDISATDLRRRVAGGRSVRYLTPDRVAEYIRRTGLYH